jgi:hypothetical protein
LQDLTLFTVFIQIKRLSAGAKRQLLIVRVVDRRGKNWRDVGASKRATGLDAIARRVIGVRERPQGRGALLVRHRRQFRRDVIPILHLVGVGIGHTRPAIRIIVPDDDVTRALLDVRQPIGIIVGVDNLI